MNYIIYIYIYDIIAFIGQCLEQGLIPKGYRFNWQPSYGYTTITDQEAIHKILKMSSEDIMKHSLTYYKETIDKLRHDIVARKKTIPTNKEEVIGKYLKNEYKRIEDYMKSIKVKKYNQLIKEDHGKFRVHKVQGDGNCLFRSLAVGIYGDEEKHKQVRNDIVQFIVQNRDRYEPYIDGCFNTHINKMSKHVGGSDIWGTDAEIKAACDLYSSIIHVYNVTTCAIQKQTFTPQAVANAPKEVNIQLSNSHF